MDEVWRDVVGYEGYYVVSNKGIVKGLDRKLNNNRFYKGKILKQREDKNGYLVINLNKGGDAKTLKVHRLVAISFLGIIDGKNEVNHIDGDKKNNIVSNLEWVNSSENQIHAFKIGLQKPHNGNTNKEVYQLSLDGEILAEYKSLTEASIAMIGSNLGKTGISRCCLGKSKTSYGYKWKFKEKG